MSLDTAGRLDDETVRVIQAVLFTTYPPINPAVLLLAARNWYLAYGSGPVLKEMVNWLSQLESPADTLDNYRAARIQFTEKTGVEAPAEAA